MTEGFLGRAEQTPHTRRSSSSGAFRAWRGSSRRRGARGRFFYFKHALTHPWHFLGLGLTAPIGLVFWSVIPPLLMILAIELGLAVIQRLAIFRRCVDEAIAVEEQARAAKERSALLARMSEEHREELETLETLVDRIRNQIGWSGAGLSSASADCFGLGQLLASHAGVAIAHRVNKEHIDAISRSALEKQIVRLTSIRPAAQSRIQALIDARLMLLKKRIERWDQAREELEVMSHELALINDGIRLIYDYFAVALRGDAQIEDIEGLIAGLVSEDVGLRDFAGLLTDPPVVDPEILELGRKHPPQRLTTPAWPVAEGDAIDILARWQSLSMRSSA